MNQYSKIEVIDRDGWRREYPLQKPIVHIGSDSRNDIVLELGRGTGIAPLHAQLIAPTGESGYQLVNLGDASILLGLSGDQVLPPRSVVNIVDGTVFRMGDFTLVFYGGGGNGGVSSGRFTSSSEHIGLRVSLPRTRLEPNRSLDGVLTVSNLGDRGGVQFSLELEGLEPDCYDIEPGPVLASGTDQDVSFRLHHRGHKPLAGDRHITIRAVAPRAYPAEQAAVSQVVRVLPFFRHKLRLVPPAGADSSPQAKERRVSKIEAGPPPPEAKRPPKTEAAPPSQAEDWWAPTPIVAMEQAPEPESAAVPSQVEVAEPAAKAEPSLPPQVEEPAPEIEAGPPPPVAAEPMLQTEASLPAQLEEEGTPEAETAPPAPIEDEWPLEVEAGLEERQVLKLKASVPPEAEMMEEAQPEAAPPSVAEDWWAAEAEASPEGAEEQQVLKLKVDLPSEAEMEEAQVEAGPLPPTEDWWAAEAEAGPEEEAQERRVLKLKASPLPGTEQAQVEASPPPSAEDWWSEEPETDTPPQAEEEPARVKADESSQAEEERVSETEG